MRKILTCCLCGTHLTVPLVILSGKDPSVTPPKHEDREPLTPRGTAFKSYEPIARSYGGRPEPLEFTPQFWIRSDDLTEAVRLTKNFKRLGGCCGLDGCNGPNQLCVCGAEIGTLKTDCWTPLVFIAEPNTTYWIDEA